MDDHHFSTSEETFVTFTGVVPRRMGKRTALQYGSGALCDVSPLQLVPKQLQTEVPEEFARDKSSDLVTLMSEMTPGATLKCQHEQFAYDAREGGEIPWLEAEWVALETADRQLCDRLEIERRKEQAECCRSLNPLVLGSPVTEFCPFNPLREFVDDFVDEFDDFTVDPEYTVPYKLHSFENCYMYAQPRVTGSMFPVFSNGLLYRIVTAAGEWFFFNDTCQYVMQIEFTLDKSSEVVPGPNVTLKKSSSGSYEGRLRVMPGETEAIFSGVVIGFKCISTTSLLPEECCGLQMDQQAGVLLAQLDQISKAAGRDTASMTEEEALSACQRIKDSSGFIDPVFVPFYMSLFRAGTDKKFLPSFHWKRPHEFLPPRSRDECRLFCGRVLPKDPQMGSGSDAYLLSAMAIIAEFPMKVRELFRHPRSIAEGKEERRRHAYRVTVGCCGWWTTMLLDDYFPASLHGPEFARCENDLRKLWVPLLQKAYAKSHGSYAAIQHGDALETLQDFIGFPTTRFDEEWVMARTKGSLSPMGLSTFLAIEAHHHMGYIVCLSAPDTGPHDALLVKMGFCYGMSYYVMEVVRYGWHRLLKIRRTKTVSEKMGMWAPHCDAWKTHQDLAHICKMNSNTCSDESLWVDWSEALQLFDGGGVCFTRFTYYDYRIRGTFEDSEPGVVLEIRVTAPMNAYCVLSQEDDRRKSMIDHDAFLVPIMLCVTRAGMEGSDVQYFDACASTNPDTAESEPCFIIARDIAIHYHFEPQYSPFYIIPLMHGKQVLLPYTIGFLPNGLIGDVSCVRFVRITSKLSENPLSFNTADVVPVKTDYQFRKSSGVVETRRDSIIRAKSASDE